MDCSDNFRLFQATESTPLTKRNMGIWNMILNRLNVPDHLHEFVAAVFISGNWDFTNREEITLMRMARNLSSDETIQLKIYNRLKHNSSKFFKWQDQQKFTLIEREILVERTSRYRTKAKYGFPLYKLVSQLFELPLRTSQRAIRSAVSEVLENIPKNTRPIIKPDAPRKVMGERVIGEIIDKVNELIELRGSLEYAQAEISCYPDFMRFVEGFTEDKGLNPGYG